MTSAQIPAWEFNNALSLQGPLHELPRKGVDLLPRFKGEGNASANEHIRKYESIICLLNVVHEDVVCRLFPLTLEGKDFCWFNVLPIHSVHNWSQFKKLFENSFDNYDPIKIHNNLYEMQVNDGESINDFNIHFQQVFLSLHEKHRPSTNIMLECYVQSLPKDMAMFILQKGITDLHEACECTLKPEKDFKRYSSESCSHFSLYDENDIEDKSKISELSRLEEQVKVLCHEVVYLQKGRITQNRKSEINLNFSSSNRYVECLTSHLHCLKYEPAILEENLNSNTLNLSHSNSTISDHLPIFEFDHTMDKNRIGNTDDLLSTLHDLENLLLTDDKHEDNFTFPFDQSIHSNVDEDLRIINRNLQIISCSSYFEIHKLDPFFSSKI